MPQCRLELTTLCLQGKSVSYLTTVLQLPSRRGKQANSENSGYSYLQQIWLEVVQWSMSHDLKGLHKDDIFHILITGKILPRFIFALWPYSEFKAVPIELYVKDYVRKLESGRIWNWAH